MVIKDHVATEIGTELRPIKKKEIAMARKRIALKGSKDLVREAY